MAAWDETFNPYHFRHKLAAKEWHDIFISEQILRLMRVKNRTYLCRSVIQFILGFYSLQIKSNYTWSLPLTKKKKEKKSQLF